MNELIDLFFSLFFDRLCITLSLLENAFVTVPIGAVWVSKPSFENGSKGPDR